jgi:hypothetical protein
MSTVIEEVGFCGCTNEQLEAGRTCGQLACPNASAIDYDTASDREADRLRRWADEHGEDAAALAYEAEGGDDE